MLDFEKIAQDAYYDEIDKIAGASSFFKDMAVKGGGFAKDKAKNLAAKGLNSVDEFVRKEKIIRTMKKRAKILKSRFKKLHDPPKEEHASLVRNMEERTKLRNNKATNESDIRIKELDASIGKEIPRYEKSKNRGANLDRFIANRRKQINRNFAITAGSVGAGGLYAIS